MKDWWKALDLERREENVFVKENDEEVIQAQACAAELQEEVVSGTPAEEEAFLHMISLD